MALLTRVKPRVRFAVLGASVDQVEFARQLLRAVGDTFPEHRRTLPESIVRAPARSGGPFSVRYETPTVDFEHVVRDPEDLETSVESVLVLIDASTGRSPGLEAQLLAASDATVQHVVTAFVNLDPFHDETDLELLDLEVREAVADHLPWTTISATSPFRFVHWELTFENTAPLIAAMFALADMEAPGAVAEAVPAPERDTADGELVPVWFGTNRAVSRDGAFGARRDLEALHLGRGTVHVPRGHRFGSVGGSWWSRLVRRNRDAPIEVIEIEELSHADFANELGEWLDHEVTGERRALVYLHGFNTSFDEALIRAAQIGYDLKFDGAVAVFSWPSRGEIRDYLYDLDSARMSDDQFVEFLRTLRERVGVTRIDLLAHSMGNVVYAEAVSGLVRAARADGVRIGAVLLAAPDLDIDEFRHVAQQYPSVAADSTLYVSRRDRALRWAGRFRAAQRAGLAPPVTVVPTAHTIEVSNVDISHLGHGYYASAADVLRDMRAVLDGIRDPGRRMRLALDDTGQYWAFVK